MDDRIESTKKYNQQVRIIDTNVGLYYIPNTEDTLREYGVLGISAILNLYNREVIIPIYSIDDVVAVKTIAERNNLKFMERKVYGVRYIGNPRSCMILHNCVPKNAIPALQNQKELLKSPKLRPHEPELFPESVFKELSLAISCMGSAEKATLYERLNINIETDER